MWSFWWDYSAYHATPRIEKVKGGHSYQNAVKSVALVEVGAGAIHWVNNYCQTAAWQGGVWRKYSEISLCLLSDILSQPSIA